MSNNGKKHIHTYVLKVDRKPRDKKTGMQAVATWQECTGCGDKKNYSVHYE